MDKYTIALIWAFGSMVAALIAITALTCYAMKSDNDACVASGGKYKITGSHAGLKGMTISEISCVKGA